MDLERLSIALNKPEVIERARKEVEYITAVAEAQTRAEIHEFNLELEDLRTRYRKEQKS